MPLARDRQSNLIREVAAACFALPLPDQPGASLPLQVALVRDLRRPVPCKPEEEPPRRWDADLDLLKQAWWEDDWQASPTPVPPTTPKLIPIVTTAATADAVTLHRRMVEGGPPKKISSAITCWPWAWTRTAGMRRQQSSTRR